MSAMRTPPWYLRPSLVLPAIGALLVVSIIVARERTEGRDGDPTLTTYSRESQGAQGFYELSARLGWNAERRTVKAIEFNPNVIHAELDPAIALQPAEVHDLLEHVRKGGALLYVIHDENSAFTDSLHIRVVSNGLAPDPDSAQRQQCWSTDFRSRPLLRLWPTDTRPTLFTMRWTKSVEFAVDTLYWVEQTHAVRGPVVINGDATDSSRIDDSTRLAREGEHRLGGLTVRVDTTAAMDSASRVAARRDSVRRDSLKRELVKRDSIRRNATRRDSANGDTVRNGAAATQQQPIVRGMTVIGVPLGLGKIVIVSDPDFLRNDAIRMCAYRMDIAAIRALEFLRDGGTVPRRRIVFDEYHQRYAMEPGTVRSVAEFLGDTAPGHVLFQLLGASLILLISMMPRAIPPRDSEQVERRSPLEHVDALARAYAQVGGTRTAATLMVRGLRRRMERMSSRAADQNTNERFLDRIETANPMLKADVAIIRKALSQQLSTNDFALFGSALKRVELSLARV